jgi:Cytidylyltransferase-like
MPDVDYLAALLAGEISVVCGDPDGRLSTDAPLPAILLPGSFNPLHAAHVRLLQLATEYVAGSAAFELSVVNVDKPALFAAEIRRRLHQFGWRHTLWVTRAPTFVEKAELFPAATFVVGADTATRLIDPKYYQLGESGMLAAFDQIRARGCHFLVAGRRSPDQCYVAMSDVGIPENFQDLFRAIPREAFDDPLSSTALRTSS